MFLVISQDIEWCTKNLLPLNENVVIASNVTDAVHDIALISMGSHTIMSVGTYSLWGALLTGGEMTFPASKFTEKPYWLQDGFFSIDDSKLIPIKWDSD